MLKKSFWLLTSIAVLLLVAFLLLRTGDTDPDAMRTKYGNIDSQQIADGHGGFIHYRDEGVRDGPALLLVHGSSSSLHTWEALVSILADNYRLISFDQHGHGLTGPHADGDYSANANIDTALRVLDAVGVEKAVWVGNSMGGWVTWRAGLAVPERVAAMVLIDAAGVQNGDKIKPYLGARLARSWIGQLLMPQITPRSLVHASLKATYFDPSKLTESVVDRYWELLRYPGNRQATVKRANTDREPGKWDEAGSLNMPTLILWGEHDSVIPLSHARAFRAAITDSTLISYADAGHLPMEEIPGQVATDIAEWLSTLTANGEL